MLWGHLSNIFHKNYSFFDFFFIILYFLEQGVFLLFYNILKEQRELWISLIVLVVVTTASLDKLLMKSRHRKEGRIISQSLREKDALFNSLNNKEKEIKELRKINNQIIEYIEKRLKKKHKRT
jgi:hypothetical protein